MKKILVVGFMPYGYKESLVKHYPNIIWFEEREIGMSESAFAMVEVVKMMDAVMFMNNNRNDRLPYEIVCTLDNKKMHEKDEFPIEEVKNG